MKSSKQKKEYSMKIGNNVRKLRDLKGMKQEELAALLGITPGALSNIENDKGDPTLSRIEEIANVFEIKVTELFDDPQQNFTLNGPASNGVLYGTQNHYNIEKTILDTLMAQIEIKDKQIAAKDEQIKDLTTSLLSATHASGSKK
jgi:transcriptional regulator with XRE-family HTH domain